MRAHTHTHRCSFVRHFMSVCVNNPVISNCRIISTHVGSHTNTHSFSHKKLHSWGVGTQCPSVSVRVSLCVCVCVFCPPHTEPASSSLGFKHSFAGFLFPRMLQICWWWPGTCLNEGQPASAPVTHLTTALGYSIQFTFAQFITVHIILIHQNSHFQIHFNSVNFKSILV